MTVEEPSNRRTCRPFFSDIANVLSITTVADITATQHTVMESHLVPRSRRVGQSATTALAAIVSTKAQGTHRKDSPKRSRQRRSIALPSMAAAAVRRRLALAEPDPEASLFPTKTGRSLSVSNYERLLRSYIDDERANLLKLGVDVDEYTTHIYRRTAATLIERVAGITLASRLPGHANEQTTRNSYVVTADQVDPVTAEILDEVLGN
jgi:integrase